MKKVSYLICVCIFFIISCSPGKYVEIGKRSPSKMSDIVPANPRLTSFVTKNSIHIKWDSHELAKEYILYIDSNKNGSFENAVYRGNDLGIMYTPPNINALYYYKTAIKYDNWESDKSAYAYGIASDLTEDINDRINNTKENAFKFQKENEYTTYYFSDESDDSLKDIDWFYLSVGANKMVEMSIDLTKNIIGGYLLFYQEGGKVISVVSGKKMFLYNNSDNTEDIKFKIYPDASKMINKIGSYKVRLGESKDLILLSPVIYSYKYENQIRVEWGKIELSEKYMLYRSETQEGNYEKIYDGKDCFFGDNILTANSDKIYYYKINCGFYDYETPLSGFRFGAASDVTDDSYENNNSKDYAKEMGYFETLSTIYYAKDANNSIEDIDWYKVKLPQASLLQITIQNEDKLNSLDLTLIRDDGIEIGVVFGNTYVLNNNNSIESDIYFRIVVNKEKMLNRSGKYKIIKGQIISN